MPPINHRHNYAVIFSLISVSRGVNSRHQSPFIFLSLQLSEWHQNDRSHKQTSSQAKQHFFPLSTLYEIWNFVSLEFSHLRKITNIKHKKCKKWWTWNLPSYFIWTSRTFWHCNCEVSIWVFPVFPHFCRTRAREKKCGRFQTPRILKWVWPFR